MRKRRYRLEFFAVVLAIGLLGSEAHGQQCVAGIDVGFESTSAAGPLSGPIQSGDLNGDGAPDVVAGFDTVQVYFGDGAGGVASTFPLPLPSIPGDCRAIALTDVNNDGLTDILISFQFVPGVVLYRNLGTGAFAAPLGVAPFAWEVHTGDLDGDGREDAVLLTSSGIEWARNLGGAFATPIPISATFAGAAGIGDIDADGDLDILATANNQLRLYRNNGAGGFTAPEIVSHSGTGATRPMHIIDLDGDGNLDVIASHQSAILWFPGSGGSLGSGSVIPAFGFSPLELVDLNGDSLLDMVVTVQGFTVTLGFRLGLGGGTFGPPVEIALPGGENFSLIAPADFDGDGIAGFAVSLLSGVAIYCPTGPCLVEEFIRGDANLDGAVDIADAIAVLESLFLSGAPPPPCLDAADANDDGETNLADGISILSALFQSIPLVEPSACGEDPTSDSIGCAATNCP